jgi:hypothetical protein
VVDGACPKAGVIVEFHLRWNQPVRSPAGHGEDRFLDFGLGEIADLLKVEMREVGQSEVAHLIRSPRRRG